jgi:peptidoglycan/xylan/chitin deacetylase (PgdA/CDA1 family)
MAPYKRKVKDFLGRLVYATGLHWKLMRNRAVIVVFHRVAERGDELSRTTRSFRAFCDFFQTYFKVVSVSELLAKLARGEDLRGHLAITFDDGYRDNKAVAAEELKKRGLPACFFLATGFIGTDHVPWWDAEAGIQSEWMTWDDVRALRRDGFEVGAHTVHHVDLGKVNGEEAQREIEESKTRLEAELGEKIALFAYPFGHVDQCTEENRQRVRQLGLRSCMSSYGGLVTPGQDPFTLKRTPISDWYLTPFQFGFEVLLA